MGAGGGGWGAGAAPTSMVVRLVVVPICVDAGVVWTRDVAAHPTSITPANNTAANRRGRTRYAPST